MKTAVANLTQNTFKIKLKELIDYLDISIAMFTKNCKISTNALVQGYLDGTYHPTIKSLNKILNRYPVNVEWLLYGRGEMWEVDYFEERFKNYQLVGQATPSEIVKNLRDVFETNYTRLAKRLGVTDQVIQSIATEKTKVISSECKRVFTSNVKFIPLEYYN